MAKADPHDPQVETLVSHTLQDNFTFVCFRVDTKNERLSFEAALIGLLSQHPMGQPSANWLGKYSPSAEIRDSGLWNIRHVHGKPLAEAAFKRLEELVSSTRVKAKET